MEPIEIIRAACIKTNPEIMELKFGCFVKGNYDEYLFTQSYKGSYCFINKSGANWLAKSEELFEIVGRPIRFADVLLAILKTKDGCTKGEMKDILLELAYLWNCFADNLSQQSPETLQFLSGLLDTK